MAPTFYIEKPHPPPEMFGVLGYERIKREHEKAWAAASPEVRAEAKQYADHVLRNRNWSRPATPKKLLTEHESKRLHRWIHGNTDHIEELVAFARAAEPDDLFMPTETCSMGIVEINLNQKFPLMPECLQERDCECHPAIPDYRAQRCLDVPDCIVVSSDLSTNQDDGASEGEGSPRPAVDKGKGVDRAATVSETTDCFAVASPPISCSDVAGPKVRVRSTTAFDKGKSIDKRPPESEVIPNGVEDGTHCDAADALSIPYSPISIRLPENTQQDKDTSPAASKTISPITQKPTAASGKSTKKVYTCQWSKYFGGPCNYTANTAQSHDRHVVTHVPDEDGHQVTQYKCTICGREFARKCSFQRHVKCMHKKDDPDRYREEATRPWYWPELLFASESMKMKPRAEPPPGNKLTCLDKIGMILAEHKINSAKKQRSDDGIMRDTPSSGGRPEKRRKTG